VIKGLSSVGVGLEGYPVSSSGKNLKQGPMEVVSCVIYKQKVKLI
jgi:hypothetical protein